jgi:hypothetical protein
MEDISKLRYISRQHLEATAANPVAGLSNSKNFVSISKER